MMITVILKQHMQLGDVRSM